MESSQHIDEKAECSDIDYVGAYCELKQQQPLSDPRTVLSMSAPFHDWRDYFAEHLDYEAARQFVTAELDSILDIFGREGVLRVEHVGSTSIPGMCGMLLPDLILYVKQFPPSNQVFQKLVSSKFMWRGLSPHLLGKDDDLFFTKRILTTPKDGKTMMGLALHIVPESFKSLDPLVKFRDLARSNPQIRDDYRNAKLEVFRNPAPGDSENWMKYKSEKSKKFVQDILTPSNFAAKAPQNVSGLHQFLMPKP